VNKLDSAALEKKTEIDHTLKDPARSFKNKGASYELYPEG